MKNAATFILFALSLGMSSTAIALPVSIDTDGFSGRYRVLGTTLPLQTGSQNLDLEPGNYALGLSSSTSVPFKVEPDGDVTVNSPTVVASGNVLKLVNLPLKIEPNAYESRWNLESQGKFFGSRTFHLPVEVRFRMSWGEWSSPSVRVWVAANGEARTESSVQLTPSGSQLFFNTAPVLVDPNGQLVRYHIAGGRKYAGVIGSYNLVVGVAYKLSVGDHTSPFVELAVAPDGSISTTSTGRAFVNGNVLELQTTPVSFQVGSLDPRWALWGGPKKFGDQSYYLVFGTTYWLYASDGSTPLIEVAVDMQGNVSSSFPFASGQGNALTLDTVELAFEPGGYTGRYAVFGGPGPLAGDAAMNLVPGRTYILRTDFGDGSLVVPADPCNEGIDDVVVGSARIEVSCAVRDRDADGVEDDVDNCPDTSNATQADFDSDGTGDACDLDVDGDGVANDDDLCSETPPGVPTTADGCSGEQFVQRICSAQTRNHGQYVSCVARASQVAVRMGILERSERKGLVTGAARRSK